MALNEEIREQRKKLKGKGVKAHLQWFWDYEKLPTLLIGIAAAVLIALIVQWATYKSYAFGVMFLNADATAEDQDAALSSGFMDYAGIDSSQYQIFTDLDEKLRVWERTTDQSFMYTQQKIMAEMAANQIDAVIMDPECFAYYLPNETLTDLRDSISDATLTKLEGKIYYVDRSELERAEQEEENPEAAVTEDTSAATDSTMTYGEWEAEQEKRSEEIQNAESVENFTLPDPSTMEDPVPVGILVNDSPYLQANHNFDQTAAIFGVISGGDHPEYCEAFLEYLYEK